MKHASRAPWVRFFRISIHGGKFGYDVTYVHPPIQTAGVEVGKQESLWRRSVCAIFLGEQRDKEEAMKFEKFKRRKPRGKPRKEKKRKFQ